MDYQSLLQDIRTYGSKGWAIVYGVSGAGEHERSAEGAWITGHKGKRFLDCGSFALFMFGHGNSKILVALQDLLSHGLSGTSRVLCHAELAVALKKLVALTPPHLQKAMLLNSGSEAVEAAIKLCRLKTKRRKLAHLGGSYHGKTAGALSLTDHAGFKADTHPLLQDVVRIERGDMAKLETVLASGDIAGLFVEAVQGEGGIHPIEPAFLQMAHQLCRQHGTLLVADEIQSGLGRTGRLWAFERSDIKPDIVLVGKSLGGGIVPVSALIASEAAFSPFDHNPYLHSSTYGGNPLACRAVIAVTEIVQAKNFLPGVEQKGTWIESALDQLHGQFSDVLSAYSGFGLMRGLHFSSSTYAAKTLEYCLKTGLLLSPCLSNPTVLRLVPPYCIEHSDVDYMHGILQQALHNCRTLQESS
ncbi:MAG: aspartate aminotransferase family protein [Nitrococcus mobilis]|nr:aspartate aminotransferase family protein [Nitrococcus mobilis]